MTSVCTGALVLGAAGLLDGYQATTHWASHDNLAHFGATAVRTRVATTGTASPAAASPPVWTSGSTWRACSPPGDRAADPMFLEYTPEPPFTSGSPDTAPKHVLAHVSEAIAPMLARRKEATLRAAQRLKAFAP